MRYWLTPLPPPGDLVVVCAWPARGLVETQTVIAADLIAAGADRIVELWPWEPPADHEPPPPSRGPDLPAGSWFAAG